MSKLQQNDTDFFFSHFFNKSDIISTLDSDFTRSLESFSSKETSFLTSGKETSFLTSGKETSFLTSGKETSFLTPVVLSPPPKPCWIEPLHIKIKTNPIPSISMFLDKVNFICYEKKSHSLLVEYAPTQTDIISFKINLYLDHDKKYIVEFQKNSGDSIYFASLYKNIISFLNDNKEDIKDDKDDKDARDKEEIIDTVFLFDQEFSEKDKFVDIDLLKIAHDMLKSKYVETFTMGLQIYTKYFNCNVEKDLFNNNEVIESFAKMFLSTAFATLQSKYVIISFILNAWMCIELRDTIIKYDLLNKIYDSLKNDTSLIIQKHVQKLAPLCSVK